MAANRRRSVVMGHRQQLGPRSTIGLTVHKVREGAAGPGSMGAFSHSARTAPIITVIIRVTAPKTTHLRNHAQLIQNSKIQTSDACHGSQGPKFCPL